jgi:single-strand DNA-binding protein
MYGKMAETANEYMRKGQMVYVEGRLQTNEWEDQNKNKRRTTEIRCDNFTMLGRRTDGSQTNTTPNNEKTDEQDDDLPF